MLPAISGTFSDTNKPTRHSPSRRLPALDGLRAVAVLVAFGDGNYSVGSCVIGGAAV